MIDSDVIQSPAFIILSGLGVGGIALGYILGKQMGFEAFPIWQVIIIMLGAIVAAYFFAARQ